MSDEQHASFPEVEPHSQAIREAVLALRANRISSVRFTTAELDPGGRRLVAALESLQLGFLYNVSHESAGLVASLRVQPGRNLEPSGRGGGRLGWHTDQAAIHLRPDLLALGFQRKSPGTGVAVAAAADAVRLLSSRQRRALLEPRFRFAAPVVWPDADAVAPVLSPEGHVRAAFYGDRVKALDARGKDALKALEAACEAVAVPVDDSSIAIVSNRAALHKRPAVPAQCERLTQRVLVKTTDIAALRACPTTNDRVFDVR